MPHEHRNLAGAALFLGSLQFIIAMQVAEFLYPGYSVSKNFISDLGATCRATCVINQPSASIFNSSVVLFGVLLIATAYFLQRASGRRTVTVLFTLTGGGAVGVGIFPETFGVLHSVASLITFLFGGLSVIALSLVTKGLLRYFGTVLGATMLVALALYTGGIDLGLGRGGMERMVAFPGLLAAIGFGGYLLGPLRENSTVQRISTK